MQLLLRYHLDQDTTLHHILFDPDYDALLQQYFDGLMTTFSLTKKQGSYLFWALPAGAKYRQQLWKQGNKLMTDDGSYCLELTPTAVRAALQRREIFPTSMLDFFVLSFYYGLKCLGGFNQINYLTAMKNAYIKMQVDRGNYKSIEVCARAQTKEMNDGYLVAFAQLPGGGLVPATGLDLALFSDTQTWPVIKTLAQNITLAESLQPAMAEFYRFAYAEAERQPELANLTVEQITADNGLGKKLKPCIAL